MKKKNTVIILGIIAIFIIPVFSLRSHVCWYKRTGYIPVPLGFGWVPPINLLRSGSTILDTGFDISKYMVRGVPGVSVYYVDRTRPNDSGSGLTPALAKQTLYGATSLAGRREIHIISSGVYIHANGANVSPITSDRTHCSIIGDVANVMIREAESKLTSDYVKDGASNMWRATYARSATRVLDKTSKDLHGLATDYILVASSNAVAATAGTFYVGGGSVCIRAFDDRAMDDNIVMAGSLQPCLGLGNFSYYFKNITFEGGAAGINTSYTPGSSSVIAIDSCTFRYTYSGGSGVSLATFGTALIKNCLSEKCANDGYNYSVSGNVLEVDCIGRYNGIAGGATHNGSSCHNSVKIVRVRGQYYENIGPNVPDVNTTYSWNLGVYAHDSVTLTAGSNSDFLSEYRMWLDSCHSKGSTWRGVASSGAAAIVYTRKGNYENTTDTLISY